MSLIHRYQSNGYNIVLDINSGCIHLVDLVTYEVLPCMENELSTEEIVERLKDRFSPEETELLFRNVKAERRRNAFYQRYL